jgi:hypothetical protein
MSANCEDFLDFPVLPGDVLSDGSRVIGLKSGRLFAKTRDGTIAEVNSQCSVIVRHAFSVLERFGGFVSVFNLPPQRASVLGKRTKTGTVAAATSSSLVICSDDGKIQISRSLLSTEFLS